MAGSEGELQDWWKGVVTMKRRKSPGDLKNGRLTLTGYKIIAQEYAISPDDLLWVSLDGDPEWTLLLHEGSRMKGKKDKLLRIYSHELDPHIFSGRKSIPVTIEREAIRLGGTKPPISRLNVMWVRIGAW